MIQFQRHDLTLTVRPLPWTFGDYVGLVSMDFPEPNGRFYASWADSQDAWGTPTCDWSDINTAHQHTMGVQFE